MVAGVFSAFAQEPSTATGSQSAQSAQVHPKRHSNRLLQLEERITRALKGLSADTGVQPLGPKMRTSVVRRQAPNKEEQADALAKRDWMLMTPEDFAEHEASMELRKMLKDGGFMNNPAISSENQWLNDLNRNNGGTTRGLVDSMMSGEMQRGPNPRENSTPTEVARTEENLRSLMRDRQSSWRMMGVSNERERNLADAFRPSEDLDSFGKKEDSYVEDYRKLMTPAPVQSFASTVPGLVPGLTDPVRPIIPPTGLDAMNASARSIFTPQLGSIAPLTSPRAPLEATERALNAWNRFYVPPQPEPPKSLAPPKPTFEAPRRKF